MVVRVTWVEQLKAVAEKGKEAHGEGVSLVDNPYRDSSSNLQRQRELAWSRGWREGENNGGPS